MTRPGRMTASDWVLFAVVVFLFAMMAIANHCGVDR